VSFHRLPPPPPYLPVEGDWLDLTTFCSELQLVLTHESADSLPAVDFQPLFLSLLTPQDSLLVRTRGPKTLVHLLVVFSHYADWAVSVGVALGLADNDAQMADQWVASLPRTHQYLRNLNKLVSQCITRLSAELEKDQGYTMGEVYVDAFRRGESLDQTRIRHQHASRGLKQIKGTNDDNG